MTKIGIIGATGKLGKIITEKAVAKGFDVTAVVRNKSKLDNFANKIAVVEKDLMDLTAEDIKNFDVVYSAFGAPIDNLGLFSTTTEHLAKIFKDLNTRLIIAGGAGVLEIDDNGTRLIDTENIPPEFRPLAVEEVKAFEIISKANNVKWTYMAPPAVMLFDAPEKGEFVLTGKKLLFDDKNESFVSYSDYASAFLAEIDNPHIQEIVGVRS